VTVTVGGTGRTQYFENLLVRVGRAIDSFSYQSQSAPISDTMPGVVAGSVGRLTAALNG
jgi:hypothetical protein